MSGKSRVLQGIVPLKSIEYGVYEGLIRIYPRPYSIYFRGIITAKYTPDPIIREQRGIRCGLLRN